MWCLADQNVYVIRFDIYQGKNTLLNPKYENYGLGERVVLQLTEKEVGKHKIIYFDNFFTSITLLEKLKSQEILACGTIRGNRKGVPQNMVLDKKNAAR